MTTRADIKLRELNEMHENACGLLPENPFESARDTTLVVRANGDNLLGHAVDSKYNSTGQISQLAPALGVITTYQNVTKVSIRMGSSQRVIDARVDALDNTFELALNRTKNDEVVTIACECIVKREKLDAPTRALLVNLPNTLTCIGVVTEQSLGWRIEIQFRMKSMLRQAIAKIEINQPDKWLNGSVFSSIHNLDATCIAKTIGVPTTIATELVNGDARTRAATLATLERAPSSVVGWTIQSLGCFTTGGFESFMGDRFDMVIRKRLMAVAQNPGLCQRVNISEIDSICSLIINDEIISNNCKDIALSLLARILEVQLKASKKSKYRRCVIDCWYESYTEKLISNVKARMSTH